MLDLAGLAAEAVRAADVPGVAVAVVRGGQVVGTGAAGLADLATGAPMTAGGACNWFSMTKIATATAAMMLSEAGSLDLDAPVATYLGHRWPTGLSAVRVRQLLSHSGGLANPVPIRWVHLAGRPRPDPATFLSRRLARQGRPRFEPGTRARYSNLGYLAVGELIAAVARSPYESFVRDQLLRPLGMLSTAFSWADPALSGIDRVTGYHRLARPVALALAPLLPAGVLGARSGRLVALSPFEVDGSAYGGLIGPVTDAARLLALHAGRGSCEGTRLLSPASVDAMVDIGTPGRPYDLGLGWFRPHRGHDAAVEHLGGGMGFWNVMRLDPGTGRGAVVMSNISRHWPVTALADASVDLQERHPAR